MSKFKKVFCLLAVMLMLVPTFYVMAIELTSSDVTITSVKKRTFGGIKMHDVIIKIANPIGKTYPTGGVPLPAASSWGMVSSVQQLILTDTTSKLTTGTSMDVVKWDKANNKLLFYTENGTVAGTMSQMASSKTSECTSNIQIPAIVIGW